MEARRKTRERASVICVENSRLLAVRLEDPVTRLAEVYLPGGALEINESPANAAIRETSEETGFDVTLDVARERVLCYPFTWGGEAYDCVTYFFPARLVDPLCKPRPVHDASYHRGVEWVELAAVPQRFGYHAGILGEILALLDPGCRHADAYGSKV
jgi:8-oxo-dGTP pyrophosphatase MutT (NUDIX family)